MKAGFHAGGMTPGQLAKYAAAKDVKGYAARLELLYKTITHCKGAVRLEWRASGRMPFLVDTRESTI